MADGIYCEVCKRVLAPDNFYKSNNRIKYPNNDGKINTCRKCFTMFVNNWEPETYLPLLEDLDVPYVPQVWATLMSRYAKDPSKINGTTILGRYLASMKMNQWNKYRWADTKHLQELEDMKREQALKNVGYTQAQVDKEMARDLVAEIMPPKPPPTNSDADYFDQRNGINEDDLKVELTDEEKLHLRLKWGKMYKVEEWVQLEKLYNEMMESYEIQTAGHIDTLKLICKTSLKANQLIDMGDIEGYQKMSRVYDTLMKSGRFKLDGPCKTFPAYHWGLSDKVCLG